MPQQDNPNTKKLREQLDIVPNEVKECNITVLRDCLDQTELSIELPFNIEKEDVRLFSENLDVSWITDSIFIIDKPYYYRLLGTVGNYHINVMFRIIKIKPIAWQHLKDLLLNLIENRKRNHA